MVKIIYKEGHEGEMKLSAIIGIAVPRLDGKTALVYPRVNKLPLLDREHVDEWAAPEMSEIDALFADASIAKTITDELLALDSPAAEFVRSFGELFDLADLQDVGAIRKHIKQINKLVCEIEGADIIPEDVSFWSCLRYIRLGAWCANGISGVFDVISLYNRLSVLPVAHL